MLVGQSWPRCTKFAQSRARPGTTNDMLPRCSAHPLQYSQRKRWLGAVAESQPHTERGGAAIQLLSRHDLRRHADAAWPQLLHSNNLRGRCLHTSDAVTHKLPRHQQHRQLVRDRGHELMHTTPRTFCLRMEPISSRSPTVGACPGGCGQMKFHPKARCTWWPGPQADSPSHPGSWQHI